MLQFTNGFSCALDPQKGDLIITFVQRIPIIDEDDEKAKNLKTEEVVSVVMNENIAQILADSLNEILKTEEDN